MSDTGHWTGPFTEDEIKKSEGFVYLIRNQITNKSYIGRKYVWSRRKVKGKTRRSKTESNWREYTSSSEELNDDIINLGKNNFHFEILSIHPTRSDTNYEETKQLMINDVLTAELDDLSDFKYYNKNISSCKRFRRNKD